LTLVLIAATIVCNVCSRRTAQWLDKAKEAGETPPQTSPLRGSTLN